MSVSSDSSNRYQCKVCKDSYEAGEGGPERDLCSTRCYHRNQGEKALRTVYNDHTLCSTCGRKRAEVTLPKPDEAFAIDESYDAAWNVVDGQVTYENYGQQESAKASIGFRLPTIHEVDGHCRCGTMEKTGDGHFDVLGPVETDFILIQLRNRIKEAAIEGQRETWPSKGEMLRTFEETGDLEYSVGVSLE